jgi:hypothetical protein
MMTMAPAKIRWKCTRGGGLSEATCSAMRIR